MKAPSLLSCKSSTPPPRHHGPDWLWTLPDGLRPMVGSNPWHDAARLLATLSVQSTLRPFLATFSLAGQATRVTGAVRAGWIGPAALTILAVATMVGWWGLGYPLAWQGVFAVIGLAAASTLIRRRQCWLSYDGDRSEIHVSWQDGWRRRSLVCPLNDYLGVARWSGAALHQVPLFTWTQRWWVVALVHRDDPTLSIPVGLAPTAVGLAVVQSRAAEALGLPVLLDGLYGAGWGARAPAEALRSLQDRVYQGEGSAAVLRAGSPTAFSEVFPAGGSSAWLQEVKDRWLALLFLLPLGGVWGGPWGLLGCALLPTVVGVALWRYWQHGDGWSYQGRGQPLRLRLGRRWAWRAAEHEIPMEDVLAIRFVDSASQSPAFEIETRSHLYRLRTGTAGWFRAQDSLSRFLRVLQARQKLHR